MDTTAKPKLSAKDFFLHVGVLAALYTFVTSFLSFLFDIINYAFPDKLAYSADPYAGSIRIALSTVIVAFPLLLILLKVLYRGYSRDPEQKELWIRKWFIYLTLFLTSVAVIIDIIYLLNTFLGGEITERFVLKALAVLVVAGGIFFATIADLRGIFFARPKIRMTSFSVACLAVIAAVVGGFAVMGSPTTQRDLRFDNQRANDLQSIQWQVLNHYQSKGALPKDLSDLSDALTGFQVPTDPQTDVQYEYRTVASTTAPAAISFELCATFARATPDTEGRGAYPETGGSIAYPTRGVYDASFGNEGWKHAAGRTCFVRTIDPVKYPIYDNDKSRTI